ncbi:hypothetical protein [Klebsiella quasipneumoniae]|uniref:hypothetical protein n=1 Tax=Klebsiella quasipneumoniae TaxID=1463165 RepID=UPI002147627F|nr:hypothetical protein [Klebsiella quasipneumoniae]MCR1231088.1 hypothetical protein [Klebsiella quasipneumoniae]
MAKDSQRGSALLAVINSDDVKDLSKEYGEIAIDSFIESGALESIPVVNSVVGIFKTVNSVRDRRFTDKLIRFIFELSDLTDAERINMTERLNSDDNFAGRAGDRLIEIIDRLESENKPEIAAAFLKAFACERIDFITLRRLMVALERVPSFDIKELEDFIPYNNDNLYHNFEKDYLYSLVNAGLAANNGGFDGGVILPTELCRTFVEFKDFKP